MKPASVGSLAESDLYGQQVGVDAAATARASIEKAALISPRLAAFAEGLSAFDDAIKEVVRGETTAEEALSRIQKEMAR